MTRSLAPFLLLLEPIFIRLPLERVLNLPRVFFVVPDDVVPDEPADKGELGQGGLDILIPKSKRDALTSPEDIKSLLTK